MAGVDDPIKQAVAALKAGRKAEARALLERIVEQDQRHEQAWFYLSAAVDSTEEQEICLENVLAINPNHAQARQGLDTLRQTQGSATASKPPVGSETEAFSGGFGAAPAQDDEQAFDWFSGTSAPEDSGFGIDDYAVPTSVDWGTNSAPAVPGSGQDIEMPSAQEWDAWVQGLNIAQDDAAASPPPASGPFADASPFMMDNESDPFSDMPYSIDNNEPAYDDETPPADPMDEEVETPSAWFSGFDDEVPAAQGSSPFGDDADAEGPFSAFTGFDSATAPDHIFAADSEYADVENIAEDSFPFDEHEVEVAAAPTPRFTFSFDDDDTEDDEVEIDSVPRPVKAPAQSAPARAAQPGAEYFRLIPGEIEAGAAGVEPRGLMMLGGILILLVLNVISFAALLL